jgi:hypothetical protein
MCSERAGGVTGRSTDRREGARAQGKGEGNFMIKNGRFGFGEILCRREMDLEKWRTRKGPRPRVADAPSFHLAPPRLCAPPSVRIAPLAELV